MDFNSFLQYVMDAFTGTQMGLESAGRGIQTAGRVANTVGQAVANPVGTGAAVAQGVAQQIANAQAASRARLSGKPLASTGAPTAGEPGGPPLADGPQMFPGSPLSPGGPVGTAPASTDVRGGSGFAPRPPTGTAAAAGDDATRARNRLLFADADPRVAMMNSMQDAGLNPYQANPFMEMIMDAAPGLQASFMMRGARSNMTPGDIDAAGGMGGLLRDHLTQALTSGNINSELSGARAQLGSVPMLLDQFAMRRAKGELGMDENPFMGLLEAAFSNPQAAQSLISGVTTPGLGSERLSASYNRGLGAAMQGAVRRQAGDYGRATTPSGDPNNPALGSNFWSYLWGGPRG